ncbi:MAG: GFA family protein [Pseudomonadota bacterium]|nr:GFA family protein [Pseudomonadota bacterium]
MMRITGGCLCGAIRYEINGQPFRIANCHCDDCRKATGSAYATNLFFKENQITILQGVPKKFEHLADSNGTMTKEFCNNCGSQVFGSGTNRPGAKNVKVGSIDDANFVKPEVNLYTAHALNCTYIDNDIDNFEGMPPSK